MMGVEQNSRRNFLKKSSLFGIGITSNINSFLVLEVIKREGLFTSL